LGKRRASTCKKEMCRAVSSPLFSCFLLSVFSPVKFRYSLRLFVGPCSDILKAARWLVYDVISLMQQGQTEESATSNVTFQKACFIIIIPNCFHSFFFAVDSIVPFSFHPGVSGVFFLEFPPFWAFALYCSYSCASSCSWSGLWVTKTNKILQTTAAAERGSCIKVTQKRKSLRFKGLMDQSWDIC